MLANSTLIKGRLKLYLMVIRVVFTGKQSWAQEIYQMPDEVPAKSHHGRSSSNLRDAVNQGPSCLPLQVQNQEHALYMYPEL